MAPCQEGRQARPLSCDRVSVVTDWAGPADDGPNA